MKWFRSFSENHSSFNSEDVNIIDKIKCFIGFHKWVKCWGWKIRCMKCGKESVPGVADFYDEHISSRTCYVTNIKGKEYNFEVQRIGNFSKIINMDGCIALIDAAREGDSWAIQKISQLNSINPCLTKGGKSWVN